MPTAPTHAPDAHAKPPPTWPKWCLLLVFCFVSFESMLLAAALKGPWFILAAPGVVCGFKALDAWRELKRALRLDDDARSDSGADSDPHPGRGPDHS